MKATISSWPSLGFMTYVRQIGRGVSAARAHEESDKSKHAAEERKPIKDAEQAAAKAVTEERGLNKDAGQAAAKATTKEREPNKDVEQTAVAKKKKHKKNKKEQAEGAAALRTPGANAEDSQDNAIQAAEHERKAVSGFSCPEILAARQRMITRRFGGHATVQVGGKGSFRRKHKAARKTATSYDWKLKSTVKKLGAKDIPEIEEVNLFTGDSKVIHFQNPKVQAIAASTYVVSGSCVTRPVAGSSNCAGDGEGSVVGTDVGSSTGGGASCGVPPCLKGGADFDRPRGNTQRTHEVNLALATVMRANCPGYFSLQGKQQWFRICATVEAYPSAISSAIDLLAVPGMGNSVYPCAAALLVGIMNPPSGTPHRSMSQRTTPSSWPKDCRPKDCDPTLRIPPVETSRQQSANPTGGISSGISSPGDHHGDLIVYLPKGADAAMARRLISR